MSGILVKGLAGFGLTALGFEGFAILDFEARPELRA